jgi:hypothetical protein
VDGELGQRLRDGERKELANAIESAPPLPRRHTAAGFRHSHRSHVRPGRHCAERRTPAGEGAYINVEGMPVGKMQAAT